MFEPKKLDIASIDTTAVRYSQFGALFLGSFNKVSPAPASLCKTLWEAPDCLAPVVFKVNDVDM